MDKNLIIQMPVNKKDIVGEYGKLINEIKVLKRQLREGKETIEAIKAGNIDALVGAEKKYLKIYTEKTADKIYRILIERMHEGAVTLNKDGTILYSNLFFAKLVSQPLQKVIGAKLKNFIADSSKYRFEAILKQGRKSAVKEELYLYKKDGNTLPVLMGVNSLSLDNSFVLSIIITDVSTLKKYQEELRLRSEQLEQKNKELASQNKEKEKRSTELNIANKKLDSENKKKAKLAAELIIANKELLFQNKEKEKRAAELKARTIQLEKSTELLSDLFNLNPAATTITRIDNEKIIICNKAFLNLFGLASQEEVVGKTFTELNLYVKPEDEGKSSRWLKNRSSVNDKEVMKRNRQGDIIWVSISIIKIKFNNIPCLLTVSINITKRKQAEAMVKKAQEKIIKLNEQLEATVQERTRDLGSAYNRLEEFTDELKIANEAKDKFIGIISHDLRNPLSVILFSSEMLLTEKNIEREETQSLLKVINSSTHKMKNQLNEVVEWAKQKNKKINFNPQVANLYHFVELSLELIEEIAKGKNIKINNSINKELRVNADPLLLRSIFQNIITNSINFTPKGGQITIKAIKKSTSFIEVSIKDTGVGMTDDALKLLFSDEAAMTSASSGSAKTKGLGLILVKDFVEKHNGNIRVESKKGKGTTFYFTLPVAD